MDFELSRYITSDLPDEERNPDDTVKEYLLAFQRWAHDCHDLISENRKNLAILQTGPARKALKEIQQKYCTSKNRQYWRSNGYYFYGGTYDVFPVISSTENINDRSCIIITEKHKPNSPPFRFMLEKHGKVWLIDSLESNNGDGKWRPCAL